MPIDKKFRLVRGPGSRRCLPARIGTVRRSRISARHPGSAGGAQARHRRNKIISRSPAWTTSRVGSRRRTSASARRAAPPAISTSGMSTASTASRTSRSASTTAGPGSPPTGTRAGDPGRPRPAASTVTSPLPARVTTSARRVFRATRREAPHRWSASSTTPRWRVPVSGTISSLTRESVRRRASLPHPSEGRCVLLPEPHGVEGLTPGPREEVSRCRTPTEGTRGRSH